MLLFLFVVQLSPETFDSSDNDFSKLFERAGTTSNFVQIWQNKVKPHMSSDGRFATCVPSKATYIVIRLLKRSYFILVMRPSPSKQSGGSQREDQCASTLQPKRRKIETEGDMPDHFDKGLESCFLGMYTMCALVTHTLYNYKIVYARDNFLKLSHMSYMHTMYIPTTIYTIEYSHTP